MKLGADAETWAADQAEELPPPKEEQSVLVNNKPDASRSQKLRGWGLVGPCGRHYCIGLTALADYQRGGQRHVVTLEAENPAEQSTLDESFVYFRETTTGHRWAIARQPSIDQRFRIYFQEADRRGVWQLFQRAQATWDQEPDGAAPVLLWNEPICCELLLTDLLFCLP